MTIKDLQEVRKDGFIRLFQYMKEVGKLIGWDKTLEILENLVIEKRLKWLDENKDRLNLVSNNLEETYNIFYHEYLGLSTQDVKIVEKSERKIVTRWYNYCPVLEACKALGLDTREICKKVYERSTQIFLEKINSRIKFSRNYDKIRPYTEYCEEILELRD